MNRGEALRAAVRQTRLENLLAFYDTTGAMPALIESGLPLLRRELAAAQRYPEMTRSAANWPSVVQRGSLYAFGLAIGYAGPPDLARARAIHPELVAMQPVYEPAYFEVAGRRSRLAARRAALLVIALYHVAAAVRDYADLRAVGTLPEGRRGAAWHLEWSAGVCVDAARWDRLRLVLALRYLMELDESEANGLLTKTDRE